MEPRELEPRLCRAHGMPASFPSDGDMGPVNSSGVNGEGRGRLLVLGRPLLFLAGHSRLQGARARQGLQASAGVREETEGTGSILVSGHLPRPG